MSGVGRLLTVAGTVLLLHAGYSSNQYKTLIVAAGDSRSLPPVDVLLECALSFFLILLGQLAPLNLESILVTPDKKFSSFEDKLGAPEFIRFNTRGRALHQRLR